MSNKIFKTGLATAAALAAGPALDTLAAGSAGAALAAGSAGSAEPTRTSES